VKIVVGVAVLLLLPSAAFAQGNPGPFGGLFGRTPERVGRDYTLFELRGSTGLQWDDSLLGSEGEIGEQVYAGLVGSALGALFFERQNDRMRLEARSTTEFRVSVEDQALGGTSFHNYVRYLVRPTTRVTVDASAMHLYSPFFQFQPTAFVIDNSTRVMSGLPNVATMLRNNTVGGEANLAYQYGKHSTVSASVTGRETRFDGRPEYDLSLFGFQGVWRRGLSRGLQLRLGYSRDEWRSRLGTMSHIQEELLAGVDFTKAFSIARKTSLSFSTETVALRRADTGRRYRLNGSVSLDHQMGRTWLLALHAGRTSEFVAGFNAPVLGDTVSMSFSGLLAPRLELVTVGGATKGDYGFDSELGSFNSAHGVAMVNFAVTRKFGLFTQVGFYHHDLPSVAATVAPVRQLSRRTVMVGVTTWIPLHVSERGTSDSR
jgi:hypothetical protein